jgi:hypothetical protein
MFCLRYSVRICAEHLSRGLQSSKSPAAFARPGDSYRALKTVRPILGAAFRLILRFHVRFVAKHRATLGSSCQFRLCKLRAPQAPNRRRARFRAHFRLRCAPGIDSASLRSTPSPLRNECLFLTPERLERYKTRGGETVHHTCHRKSWLSEAFPLGCTRV